MTTPELPLTFHFGRQVILGLLVLTLLVFVVWLYQSFVASGELEYRLYEYEMWSDDIFYSLYYMLDFPWNS